MVLEVDGQTDRQTESWRSKKTFGQLILILRLSCIGEVKDIYTVLHFAVFNKFSE